MSDLQGGIDLLNAIIADLEMDVHYLGVPTNMMNYVYHYPESFSRKQVAQIGHILERNTRKLKDQIQSF